MRRLHEAMRQFGPVTPVVWSRYYDSYCTLSASEQKFLEQPFARHEGAMPDPTVVGMQLRQGFRRLIHHGRNKIPYERLCQSGHTLVMPDVCEDSRAAWIGRAAADGRLRMVAIFNDAIPFVRPDLTPGFRLAEFDGFLRCLSKFGAVVTCSEESREGLLAAWDRLGCARVPVLIEPWPTDFGPRGRAEPARFDRHRVLYVSSLDPRKNHIGLFDACERLWGGGVGLELELIGRRLHDVRFSQPVIDAVRRMQERGRPVRWRGHVPDEALVAAYQECSFTVYPSFIEGFGLPIHESLWFGRPCVCGTNGALGEVSAGGGCLPCDQTRVESLAAAVRQLLTDRALYVKLSEEAARRPFRSWMDYARALRGRLGE